MPQGERVVWSRLADFSLLFSQRVSKEAFDASPLAGNVFQSIAATIRSALDKELGGKGWCVVVGRSFGWYVCLFFGPSCVGFDLFSAPHCTALHCRTL